MGATPSSVRSWFMLFATVVVLAGCKPDVPPMPYAPPPVGTLYDYGAQTNTITSVNGWRTSYRDNVGREGTRVGLFITEDPRRPFTIDSAAMGGLWPLRLGEQAVVTVKRDGEVYRWDFNVTDTATITVPAGTFSTFIVQGVERPELVHDPATAVTVSNQWWVAPPHNTVVRFVSTYVTGPAAGRQVVGELKAVRTASVSDSIIPRAGQSSARLPLPGAREASSLPAPRR